MLLLQQISWNPELYDRNVALSYQTLLSVNFREGLGTRLALKITRARMVWYGNGRQLGMWVKGSSVRIRIHERARGVHVVWGAVCVNIFS